MERSPALRISSGDLEWHDHMETNWVPGGFPLHRGYPAKRALSAMRKHVGYGPFGRKPSISQKANNAEVWWFLYCLTPHAVKQTWPFLVIWHAIRRQYNALPVVWFMLSLIVWMAEYQNFRSLIRIPGRIFFKSSSCYLKIPSDLVCLRYLVQ